MHYGQYIPTETGSIIIEVTNNAEYNQQGWPILGPTTKNQFSERDVIQCTTAQVVVSQFSESTSKLIRKRIEKS